MADHPSVLVKAVRHPLLVLNGNLRVEAANAAFYELFQVSKQQVQGQPIFELGNGRWDIPSLRELLARLQAEACEGTAITVEQRFPEIGHRRMFLHAGVLSASNAPDRILISIADITDAHEQELTSRRDFAGQIVDAVREPVLILDWDLHVKSANRAFYATFGTAPEETQGRVLYELGGQQWDIPGLRELLQRALVQNEPFDGYEVERDFPGIGHRIMLLNARRIDHVELVLLAIEDVTERRTAERRRQFLAEWSEEIRNHSDPAAISRRVCSAVAEHLGVDYAAYGQVKKDQRQVTVLSLPAAAGNVNSHGYPLESFGTEILHELRAGHPLTFAHSQDLASAAPWAETVTGFPVQAMLCVPVVRKGRLRAIFTVAHGSARHWTSHDVAMVEQLAERLCSSIERAHAQRMLQQSEAQFRGVVECQVVGIFFWRVDGLIIDANQKLLDLIGYPREALDAGQLRWTDLTPPEFSEQDALMLEELRRRGRSETYEKEYLRKDGTRVPVLIGASFLPDRKDLGVAFVVDITARKQALQQLRELTETLEKQVADRTALAERRAQQLQGLAAQLSRAEELERRRLALVLHDHLQQVLVAAKMRVTLVRDETADDAPRRLLQQCLDMLDEAVASTRSLAVELSPPILYEQGLPPALEWLARRMLDQHGLVVEVIADPLADPEHDELRSLLLQSARELLLNVVKHAQTKSVAVRLARSGAHVQLEVIDRGRGFDSSGIDTLYESFGLLHLHERLTAIGGWMAIESAPGRGTHATVTAPLRLTGSTIGRASSAVASPERSVVTAAKTRVLLVDDSDILRESLTLVLNREPDIEVVGEAADGRTAVEMARALQPDIVVMDFSLPGMSGSEATRQITTEMPQVRVIGLSLHDEDAMRRSMLDAGAIAYLVKDKPPRDLVVQIRAAVGWH